MPPSNVIEDALRARSGDEGELWGAAPDAGPREVPDSPEVPAGQVTSWRRLVEGRVDKVGIPRETRSVEKVAARA